MIIIAPRSVPCCRHTTPVNESEPLPRTTAQSAGTVERSGAGKTRSGTGAATWGDTSRAGGRRDYNTRPVTTNPGGPSPRGTIACRNWTHLKSSHCWRFPSTEKGGREGYGRFAGLQRDYVARNHPRATLVELNFRPGVVSAVAAEEDSGLPARDDP